MGTLCTLGSRKYGLFSARYEQPWDEAYKAGYHLVALDPGHVLVPVTACCVDLRWRKPAFLGYRGLGTERFFAGSRQWRGRIAKNLDASERARGDTHSCILRRPLDGFLESANGVQRPKNRQKRSFPARTGSGCGRSKPRIVHLNYFSTLVILVPNSTRFLRIAFVLHFFRGLNGPLVIVRKVPKFLWRSRTTSTIDRACAIQDPAWSPFD